jgi:hypothetical protein
MIVAYQRHAVLHGLSKDRLLAVLRSPSSIILLYFLLSFGWAFLSAGRVGANLNYYLENSLVMAIVFALIYDNYKPKDLPLAASLIIVVLIFGGTFQLVRVLRGEYFRWQSLDYYREVSETAAKLMVPNGTCVSVYAELVVRNGCSLHFDDFGEYVSGWSPELVEIFERELKAGRYSVIIWNTDDLQTKFPNYHLVPMSRNPPERFYPAYLYVHRISALR